MNDVDIPRAGGLQGSCIPHLGHPLGQRCKDWSAMMPAGRIVAASGRPERAPGWSGVADEGSGEKGMRLETRHATPHAGEMRWIRALHGDHGRVVR